MLHLLHATFHTRFDNVVSLQFTQDSFSMQTNENKESGRRNERRNLLSESFFAFRAEMCLARVFNINTDTCGLHHSHRDLNTVWTQLWKINPAGENRWENERVSIFSVNLLLWLGSSQTGKQWNVTILGKKWSTWLENPTELHLNPEFC